MIHIDQILERNVANRDALQKEEWLIDIFQWLHSPKSFSGENVARERVFGLRLKHLIRLLEKNPKWKQNFSETIRAVLSTLSSASLFANVGMTRNWSFFQDLLQRLEEKMLPARALSDDLSALLVHLFPESEDSDSITQVSDEVMIQLLDILRDDSNLRFGIIREIETALFTLASQIAQGALILQQELRTGKDLRGLPEFQLQKLLMDTPMPDIQRALDLVKSCERQCENYYLLLEIKGIKVETVFLLETQKKKIERLRILLLLLVTDEASLPIRIKTFLNHLIRDMHHQNSLRSFVSDHVGLLTKRIVQQNSEVGEHYVTYTWPEFTRMLRSSLGGGLVTAFTVMFKFLLGKAGAVGFVKGFLNSINYAGSFLGIYLLGFTLATKQPSNTAPFLAESMRQSIQDAKRKVIALLRTQFIAVLGNVTAVFPVCFAAAFVFKAMGMPLLTPEEAYYNMNSILLFGPSFIFAFFTGGVLFVSSLIAGWFENWVRLQRVGHRISQSPTFRRWLGAERAAAAGEALITKSNALAGNISLGFMLGLIPVFADFFSLPIDVRHVTLSTGLFASTLPYVNPSDLTGFLWFNAFAGIFMIGVLNISVAFTLAVAVAARSKGLSFQRVMKLMFWALATLVRQPWRLVLPVKPVEDESKNDLPPVT